MRPREQKRKNLLKEWYVSIPIGSFSGNPPELQLVGPDLWVHFPRPAFPFKFTRSNGEVIEPGMFSLDGGSIPGIARGLPFMSKWYYGFAYILHDYLWNLHKQNPQTSKHSMTETNVILIEAIKTLQVKGFCHQTFGGGAGTLRNVWRGVESPFARSKWKSHYAI